MPSILPEPRADGSSAAHKSDAFHPLLHRPSPKASVWAMSATRCCPLQMRPRCCIVIRTARPMTASIIGAPMTYMYGQPFVGTDDGPLRLREAGLLTSLSSLGWRVQDNPDLDFESIAQSNSSELYATERSDAKNSLLVGHGCRHLGGRCGMVACLSVVAVTSRLATRSTDRQEKRHMSERMKKNRVGMRAHVCARATPGANANEGANKH